MILLYCDDNDDDAAAFADADDFLVFARKAFACGHNIYERLTIQLAQIFAIKTNYASLSNYM